MADASQCSDSDVAESTLREVDIDSTGGLDQSEADQQSTPGLQQTSQHDISTGLQQTSQHDISSELVSTANLRPVKNSQFDHVASTGFPPAEKPNSSLTGSEGQGTSALDNDGGLSSILQQVTNTKKSPDRDEVSPDREVSGGSLTGRIDNLTTFPPAVTNVPQLSTLGLGSSNFNNSLVPPGSQPLGISHHARWLGTRQMSGAESADLSRKLQEYQASAAQRQVGLDDETIRKVREYQQKLLDTEPQRKSMLADIRADIERRRQELMSSQTSNLSRHAESIFHGLTSRMTAQQEGLEQSRSFVQSGSSSSVNPDSGLLFDPKTWEPIKPFQADKKLSRAVEETKHEADVEATSKAGVPTDKRKVSGDKIRKSLVFDDDLLRSEPQSPAVWKDVLNETSASSACNESHVTSSEEERGSPLLPNRLHLTNRADKSADLSLGNGSSLNGSELMARAEERREGFERRQAELREQLDEIQQQKDSILRRYQDTQNMFSLHRSAVPTQQTLIRQKLAQVNLQLGEEGVIGRDKPQESGTQLGGKSFEERIDVRGVGPGSGRGSACSNNDSYLEDISFQGINSPAGDALAGVPFFGGERKLPELPTWASILSSSESSFEMEDKKSSLTGSSQFSVSALVKSSHRGGDTDAPETQSRNNSAVIKEKLPLTADVLSAAAFPDSNSVPTVTKPAAAVQGAWSQVLLEHRPHELSTIVEVDTPTGSSSARASSYLTRGHLSGVHVSSQRDSNCSSQSLSSASNHSHHMTTTPTGTAEISLPDDITESAAAAGHRAKTESSQTKAKRSLDFSEQQHSAESSQSFVELYPELTTTGLDDQDLFSTPMPSLVELTPLKPVEDQRGGSPRGDTSDLSSFQISGYSDYLRQAHGGQGHAVGILQSSADPLADPVTQSRDNSLPALNSDLSSSLPSMSLVEMSITSEERINNTDDL